MIVRRGPGGEEFRICRPKECTDCQAAPFRQAAPRHSQLPCLKGDPISMGDARRMLVEFHGSIHRLNDDDALNQIALLITSGALWICDRSVAERVPASGGGAASTPELPPFPMRERSRPERAGSRAPSRVMEPATFEPSLDADAQAQVLKDAAREGVPFCEECAHAAVDGARA